jgi:hypothetical protein
MVILAVRQGLEALLIGFPSLAIDLFFTLLQEVLESYLNFSITFLGRSRIHFLLAEMLLEAVLREFSDRANSSLGRDSNVLCLLVFLLLLCVLDVEQFQC